jgi:hypothetical protein
MTTQKQIDANRRNGQKSTGPRTAEGRATSARNCPFLKHGLTAQQVTVFDEKPEDFVRFHQELHEALTPVDAVDVQLIEQIASNWWRLRRAYRSEAKLLTHAGEGDHIGAAFISMTKEVQGLSRYETALRRAGQHALHELERRQARRRGETVMAPVAVDVTIGPDNADWNEPPLPPVVPANGSRLHDVETPEINVPQQPLPRQSSLFEPGPDNVRPVTPAGVPEAGS